jgi:recombination protein RecR
VVEQPGDLLAIDKAENYLGHSHILHGVLAPMEGIRPSEITVTELEARLTKGTAKEVFIATSSTVPGEATANDLIDRLQNKPVLVIRLACGIPMDMNIKYADKHTLARAIESRCKTS